MIGRFLNKYSIIIPIIYLLLGVIYRTVSKIIYADIFLDISLPLFVMILVSLYLRDRYTDGKRTTYHAVQLLIIMVFLMVFAMSIPEYTYKEAQRSVELSAKDIGTALDPKERDTLALINPPKKRVELNSRPLTNHTYLIYFKTDAKIDVVWYMFDPYTGKYEEVEPISANIIE